MATHRLQRFTHLYAALFGVVTALVSFGCERSRAPQSTQSATPSRLHTVQLDDVTRSVIIGGHIRPSDIAVIENKVGTGWIPYETRDAAFENAQARLIYVIEEGEWVEPGDVLFEMETTLLKDILYERENEYNIAEATYVMYREAFAVAELQAEADAMAAQVSLGFARDDLAKYLEGESPMMRQILVDAVTTSTGQSESANAEYLQSLKLHTNGYISTPDLDADRLLAEEKQQNRQLAHNQLALFDRFEHPRTELELRKSVDLRTTELERAKLIGLNDIEQNRHLMNQNERTRNEYKLRLDEMRAQIENSTVRAPVAGRVMYATSNGAGRSLDWPPLIPGTRIYLYEDIIHLITSPRVHMDVLLMEGDVNRVKTGQPVRITSDLQPGKYYTGRVAQIGVMATQESVYRNPDLRRYKARIEILSDTQGLHQGSTALAEIILETRRDVPTIPVQALVPRYDPGSRTLGHSVWVQEPNGSTERAVTLGLRNPMKTEVVDGLEQGERVLLNPPVDLLEIDHGANDEKKLWIHQNRVGLSERSPTRSPLHTGPRDPLTNPAQ